MTVCAGHGGPARERCGIWEILLEKFVSLRDLRGHAALRAALETPPYFTGIAHSAEMMRRIEATADALERACAALPDAERSTAKALPFSLTMLRRETRAPARPGC